MLEDIYKSYKTSAEIILWKKYNKNDLFYEYIKHENDSLADNYYAGIVCRYWGYSGRLYTQCCQHIPFEECYDMVIDTINYVLSKRVWLNKDSSLFGDYTAPDKAFHVALKRLRSIVLAKLNANKRKSNFNALSIESMQEECNDATDGMLDICDDKDILMHLNYELHDFISSMKPTEVIILDLICYNDWKNLNTVVNQIKKVGIDLFTYYNNYYNIKKEDFIKSLMEFSDSNQTRLLRNINGLLNRIKREYYK